MAHMTVMLVGYPNQLDEFAKDMESRYYHLPGYSKTMKRDYMGRVKMREIRLYDVIYHSEVEKDVISDIKTGTSATFGIGWFHNCSKGTWKIKQLFMAIKGNSKCKCGHYYTSLKVPFLRSSMQAPFKIVGMSPPKKEWANIEASGLGKPPLYYMMHGFILARMDDDKEGYEHV